MLIDIHTHSGEHNANIKKHFNIIIPVETGDDFQPELSGDLFSAGIHPWYISEQGYTEQLEQLRHLLKIESVRLVGECGIDKARGPSLHLQEEVFVKQIRLAEEFKKPLVLHVVKAFEELISIKKVMRPKVPMIIHGFNKKPELALQLIEKGFYISLGASLFHDEGNAQKVLGLMDLRYLFLETDESSESIENIYKKASEILNLEQEVLEETIYENYLGLYL